MYFPLFGSPAPISAGHQTGHISGSIRGRQPPSQIHIFNCLWARFLGQWCIFFNSGASTTGREPKDEGIPWIVEPACCDINTSFSANQLSCSTRSLQPYSPNPAVRVPFTPAKPGSQRSVSVSAVTSLDCPTGPHVTPLLNGLAHPFYSSPQMLRRPLRQVSTPPSTPPTIRNELLKPPHTPPPPSKLRQLFPTMSRSKSHTQLANRIDEPTDK